MSLSEWNIVVVKCCQSLLQRFVQYLASRNTLFNLSNFLDKSGLQGNLFFSFIVKVSTAAY